MTHLPVVLLRWQQSRHHVNSMSFPEGRTQFAWSYLRWQRNARFGRVEHHAGPEQLAVVLLSYKRPENMAPIVRSLLRCAFVSNIVVCNNNPQHRMRDWIGFSDKRLHVIDQPTNTGPLTRFRIASELAGDYFLTIDDDVFLWPWQVNRLFGQLVDNPEVPHGLFGEYILYDFQLRGDIKYQDVSVDILSRVYALTRDHLRAFWRLIAELREDTDFALLDNDDPRLHRLPKTHLLNFNGEDIVLSFAGDGRPLIHNIGRVLCCPTGITPGVATWKEPGFLDFRVRLVQKLLELRPARTQPAAAVL